MRALLKSGVRKPRPLGLFSWMLELQGVGSATGVAPEPPATIAYAESDAITTTIPDDPPSTDPSPVPTIVPASLAPTTSTTGTFDEEPTISEVTDSESSAPTTTADGAATTTTETTSASTTTVPPATGWATNDTREGNNKANMSISVLSNDLPPADFDYESLSIVVQSDSGTATVLSNSGNPMVKFRADPDFVGTTSFVYEICDLAGDCATATVSLTILPA